ncbi:MAG TPA: hypothetical protein VHK69_01380 [Chitinophagaceae bacterium]|jgi:hypothetical protein|nr:hypothetical protein [Chitinophagaceae bacterium]
MAKFKLTVRHYLFLAGCASVLFSLLFFGRRQEVYLLMLLAGGLIACAAFVAILADRVSLRIKATWTAIALCLVLVQQWTEPLFIKASYVLFIRKNAKDLEAINRFFERKKGPVSVLRDTVFVKGEPLSAEEQKRLLEARKKVNVIGIYRLKQGVYYELWGFLDERMGITYFYRKPNGPKPYQHITGAWFR